VSNPLRAVWDEPRPPSPPGRVWRDWALLAVVVVAASLEGTLREDLPVRVLSIIVTVGLAPTLLWRRTHPFAMVALAFGISAAVDIGLIIADAPALEMVSMIYFLLLPYALFRWGSGRDATVGLAIILASATLGLFVSWTGVGDLIGGMAVLSTSMVLGVSARTQHGARERRLEQAKSEERVAFARELHDTVAHHVSAIAIHAQAGRALAATQPGAPLEALQVIEAEATRTLTEMRAMVRMLRTQGPVDYAPQTGVADLERLAGQPTGPQVEVSRSGDLGELSPAVDAAVFRIAQEAVTNARRHARNATRVDVRVVGNGTTVQLVIRDDGDPIRAGAPEPGYGVTGMVERAALLGGTCIAGPSGERGWVVDATLPRGVTT
jgi:two-component sensor histidine kinase